MEACGASVRRCVPGGRAPLNSVATVAPVASASAPVTVAGWLSRYDTAAPSSRGSPPGDTTAGEAASCVTASVVATPEPEPTTPLALRIVGPADIVHV